MAMITADFANAMSQQLFEPHVRVAADKKHWDWQQIFDVRSSDSATEQAFRTAGIGPAVLTGELEAAYYGRFRELDKTVWTHNKYTLGSFVSKEALEDNRNLPDLMKLAGEMTGEGLTYLLEYTIAQHLNRAFNSTYKLDYDGVELCGTHTLQKTPSTTVSNEMTPSSLDFDTLWLAMNHFDYQLFTHENLPMTAKPKYLIYHPSNTKNVRKILETTAGQPDTMDHSKNTLADYGLTPIPCRFLTSTYWFVASDNVKRDAIFYWRVRQETSNDADFDRDAVKFKTRMRFSSKFCDWFSMLGNMGA